MYVKPLEDAQVTADSICSRTFGYNLLSIRYLYAKSFGLYIMNNSFINSYLKMPILIGSDAGWKVGGGGGQGRFFQSNQNIFKKGLLFCKQALIVRGLHHTTDSFKNS